MLSRPYVRTLAGLLDVPGITIQASENVMQDMWEKWVQRNHPAWTAVVLFADDMFRIQARGYRVASCGFAIRHFRTLSSQPRPA